MAKARNVRELHNTLNRDVTMDDLKKFADAVTKANVNHLSCIDDDINLELEPADYLFQRFQLKSLHGRSVNSLGLREELT
ncbi:hypothetical protein BGX26_011455 [Mortierella sp. AD094]|nr:hypothetical protein BGX26_011455 [Mortierella sp. AD094]